MSILELRVLKQRGSVWLRIRASESQRECISGRACQVTHREGRNAKEAAGTHQAATEYAARESIQKTSIRGRAGLRQGLQAVGRIRAALVLAESERGTPRRVEIVSTLKLRSWPAFQLLSAFCGHIVLPGLAAFDSLTSPKLVPLHLSGRRLRQFRQEFDPMGPFKDGQTFQHEIQ